MKIAIYLEDGPDGELKMRRNDIENGPKQIAHDAAEIAMGAVTAWMRKKGHEKQNDAKYYVETPDSDLSQSERILRAFNS